MSRRRALRSSLCLASLPAILALSAIGCHERAPDLPLRIAVSSDLVTFDPHLQEERLTQSVLENFYESLFAFDSEMRVRPVLAMSWENPSEQVWRIRLRPGVRYHDGRSFTAADVVFSLNRARGHPDSMVAGFLVSIREIARVDDMTVDLITDKPYPLMLNKLCFISIVPSGSPAQIHTPMGTGPFRFAGYARGERLSLFAWEGYWGPPPHWRRAEYVFREASSERVRMLLGGEADVATTLTSDQAHEIASAPGCRVAVRPGLAVTFLGVRHDQRPLSDLRVRRAMDLGLDRRRIVGQALPEMAVPTGQFVSPNVYGHVSTIEVQAPDPGRARQLLREAGYPNGIEIEMEYPPGTELEASEIRSDLALAGIRIRATQRPWGQLYSRLATGHVSFFLAGYACDSGDASDLFDAVLHTREPGKGYGDANFMEYSNRDLDGLIEIAGSTMNMKKRREILEQAARLALADLPLIPLWHNRALYGVREGIRWEPRFDRKVLAAEIRR